VRVTCSHLPDDDHRDANYLTIAHLSKSAKPAHRNLNEPVAMLIEKVEIAKNELDLAAREGR
jgi:hypothetical protein